MPNDIDVTQYIGWAGAFTASVITGIISRRALKGSDSVKREMDGPGDEPSMRDLIKQSTGELALHRAEVNKAFDLLHVDVSDVKERISSLESAVFTEMRGRVSVLEGAVGVLTGAAASLVHAKAAHKNKRPAKR